MFGKAEYKLSIFLSWLRSLRQHEAELVFAFSLLTSGYNLFERLLFRVVRTQETSVFYKQTLTKQYILMKVEIEFTYRRKFNVVGYTSWYSRDPKQTETMIRFLFKFFNFGKIKSLDKNF